MPTMISPTADSEFLSLNSLQPMSDVAICFRFADNDFVALPGLLAKKGYSTLSAHAFERGFWNRAKVHPRYGFKQAYFDRELGSSPKMGWGLADKVFLQRALERVDKTRPPFMAFFITLTSHHPYNYLPSAEVHIDTAGLPDILAGYVASARYVDEALAALAREDPETAEVVQMRYFVGMTVPEIADALGLSPRTVDRHWAFARAWLKRTIRGSLSNGETLH